jgi:hypothetical protein
LGDCIDLHVEVFRDERDHTDAADNPPPEVFHPLDQGAESNHNQKDGPALGETPDVHLSQDNQDPERDKDHTPRQDAKLFPFFPHASSATPFPPLTFVSLKERHRRFLSPTECSSFLSREASSFPGERSFTSSLPVSERA